jgi:hypothetical protein
MGAATGAKQIKLSTITCVTNVARHFIHWMSTLNISSISILDQLEQQLLKKREIETAGTEKIKIKTKNNKKNNNNNQKTDRLYNCLLFLAWLVASMNDGCQTAPEDLPFSRCMHIALENIPHSQQMESQKSSR